MRYAHFAEWTADTLEEARLYTKASDIYQVGQIMSKWSADSGNELSQEAKDFMQKLLSNSITADMAMQEAWMAFWGIGVA